MSTDPKTAVHEICNHVYAKRYIPSNAPTPMDRATEDFDSVFDRIETAMSRIWEYAEEEGLEDVLEQEGAPRPAEVRSRYEDKLIDYRYDDEGEFDTYAFKEIFHEVLGYYEVIEDIVQVRKTGF